MVVEQVLAGLVPLVPRVPPGAPAQTETETLKITHACGCLVAYPRPVITTRAVQCPSCGHEHDCPSVTLEQLASLALQLSGRRCTVHTYLDQL